jgi:hypothetical protein
VPTRLRKSRRRLSIRYGDEFQDTSPTEFRLLEQLSDEEMAEYRRPFREAGEGRRPTLSWLRQIRIEG